MVNDFVNYYKLIGGYMIAFFKNNETLLVKKTVCNTSGRKVRDLFKVLLNLTVTFILLLNYLKAQESIILNENFEDNVDSRITFDIVGSFNIQPGVISTTHFGSNYAFTCGKSNCSSNCYNSGPYYQQPYRAIIKINFVEPTYINTLSFNWSEIEGNWGSGGMVYIDGVQFGTYPEQYIGISPPSNGQNDPTVKIWSEFIDLFASEIEIAISDIANGSQILIDNIILTGNTESFSPVLISPENNSTGIELNPTLQWQAVENATSYTLQVSLSNEFTEFVVNESEIEGTEFQINNLEYNTQYFWRVNATDGTNTSDWSEVWSFSTDSPKPILLAPSNNSTNQPLNPALQWEEFSGAESYTLQVSTNGHFINPVVNQVGINNTIYNIDFDLAYYQKYYWRVRAVADDEISDWSEVWNFTTISDPSLNNIWIYYYNNEPVIKFELEGNNEWIGVDSNTVSAANVTLTMNEYLKFTGNITIDTTDYLINASGSLFVEDLPLPLGQVGNFDLYSGEFEAELDGHLVKIINMLNTGHLSTEVFGCNIEINNFKLLGGLNSTGVEFDGKIVIPNFVGSCNSYTDTTKIDIEKLHLSTTGFSVSGASITNIGIPFLPSSCINELVLSYDASIDRLYILADFTIPWFSAKAETELLQGHINILGLSAYLSTGIPIGQTGLQLVGFLGSVTNLYLNPSLAKITLGGRIASIVPNLFEIDMEGTIELPSTVGFSADARFAFIPPVPPETEGVWQALATVNGNFKVPNQNTFITNIEGSIQAGAIEEGSYIFSGDASLHYKKTPEFEKICGNLNATITVPELSNEGFPYDIINTLLPLEIMQVEAMYNNSLIQANLNFPWPLSPMGIKLDLTKQYGDQDYFVVLANTVPIEIYPNFRTDTLYFEIPNNIQTAYFKIIANDLLPESTLFDPSGNMYTETNADSTINRFPIDDQELYWTLRNPVPGTWALHISQYNEEDSYELYLEENLRPFNYELNYQNELLQITWDTTNAPENSIISVFLDNNNQGFNGALLGEINETEGIFEILVPNDLIDECSFFIYVTRVDNQSLSRLYHNEELALERDLQPPSNILPYYNTANNKLSVGWLAPLNQDVIGYKIKLTNFEYNSDSIIANANNSQNVINVHYDNNIENSSISMMSYSYDGSISCYSDYSDIINIELLEPVLTEPMNLLIDTPLDISFIWESVEGATSYIFQLSKFEDFNSLIVNVDLLTETNYFVTDLDFKTEYFWRVCSSYDIVNSDWSEVRSFTTISGINIDLNQGWNLISSNIIPSNSQMEEIFLYIENNILFVKNRLGQVFIPLYEINHIGNWNITHGYIVYVTSPDTLQITGTEVNPTETEINLVSGWNLISYLRNLQMPVETALAGINSSLILVKNNIGQLYYPSYFLNTLGNMQPGQGYWLFMSEPAVLTYPGN